MKQPAKWFGIDDPRTVSEWEQWGIQVSEVFDEDQQCNIPLCDLSSHRRHADGLDLGLFFANETVAALARSSAPERPLECREKMLTPQLWEADSFTSTYVDNGSVFGADRCAVKHRMDALEELLRRLA